MTWARACALRYGCTLHGAGLGGGRCYRLLTAAGLLLRLLLGRAGLTDGALAAGLACGLCALGLRALRLGAGGYWLLLGTAWSAGFTLLSRLALGAAFALLTGFTLLTRLFAAALGLLCARCTRGLLRLLATLTAGLTLALTWLTLFTSFTSITALTRLAPLVGFARLTLLTFLTLLAARALSFAAFTALTLGALFTAFAGLTLGMLLAGGALVLGLAFAAGLLLFLVLLALLALQLLIVGTAAQQRGLLLLE